MEELAELFGSDQEHILDIADIVKPRLHDTTSCQSGWTTGFTTGCIVQMGSKFTITIQDAAKFPMTPLFHFRL